MSRSALASSNTSDEQMRARNRPASHLNARVAGLALILGGCTEPAVLTAPAREPLMTLVDHERIPLPIIAVPTGGTTFNRESNESAHEGMSLLSPRPADAS